MELQLLPSLTSLPIVSLTDSLPVNKNYTWAQLCGLRSPAKLTTIVIHHDALDKKKYAHLSDVELASRIATGHIGKTGDHPKGEPGNPYHVWIRSGQAYQINNLLDFTYGVSSHNGYTIHVCVSGEYRYIDVISDADYNMLCTVVVSLLKFTDLPNLKVIKAHRELDETECPGIDIAKFKDDVYNIQKQMDFSESTNNQEALAYTIAQTILWTYNTAKGLDQYGKPTITEEGKDWARKRLLLLEPAMREFEFLK